MPTSSAPIFAALTSPRRTCATATCGARSSTGPIHLRGAGLQNASFKNAVLTKADLRAAAALTCDFSHAQLAEADLRDLQCVLANFSRSDLRGADLRGVRAHGANFRGADLERSDLRGAHLRDSDFRDASLSGARTEGAHLRDAAGLTRGDPMVTTSSPNTDVQQFMRREFQALARQWKTQGHSASRLSPTPRSAAAARRPAPSAAPSPERSQVRDLDEDHDLSR